DGQGDLAYRPTRLFERLSDRNPALRLFAEGPSARAIDFAARVFPIFEPKPKFADEGPRMQPSPPPIVMAGIGATWQWPVLGGVLLLWPLALIAGRSFEARGPVPGPHNRQPRDAGIAPAGESPPSAADRAPVPAISVRGLTKRFANVNAVDDLSFAVPQGTTADLGEPNGAGRPTVLRCVLGLIPFRGTAQVLGCPCGPRGRASRQRLGYVPQEIRLHADQSVRDTVRFYAKLRKVAQ